MGEGNSQTRQIAILRLRFLDIVNGDLRCLRRHSMTKLSLYSILYVLSYLHHMLHVRFNYMIYLDCQQSSACCDGRWLCGSVEHSCRHLGSWSMSQTESDSTRGGGYGVRCPRVGLCEGVRPFLFPAFLPISLLILLKEVLLRSLGKNK